MHRGALTLAIGLSDAAVLALLYSKGFFTSFLIGLSVMMIPTLLVILWEANNRALRRLIRVPLVTIVTALITMPLAGWVNSRPPGPVVILILLMVEACLIWRLLLFRRPPPDDGGGGDGPGEPQPIEPQPPGISKPLPGEKSFAWRKKHRAPSSIELN
jgi:hypothetical protein